MASDTASVFITGRLQPRIVGPHHDFMLDYEYQLNTRPFFVCSSFQIKIFGPHDDTKRSLTGINGSYLYE